MHRRCKNRRKGKEEEVNKWKNDLGRDEEKQRENRMRRKEMEEGDYKQIG